MGRQVAVASTQDPTLYPNSSVCLIEDVIPDVGVFRGSGVIIGPHTILTAAHVLWDADAGVGASKVRVTVGSTAFGGQATLHYNRVGDYNDELDRTGSARDFGIINTTRNLSSFGSFDIATDYAGGSVNVSGYPADRGTRQVKTEGSVTAGAAAAVLNYQGFSLAPGYSGGPVWTDDGSGHPAVAGVVSTTGWACRLTGPDLARIERWAAADGDLVGGATVRSAESRASRSTTSSHLQASAAALITGELTDGVSPAVAPADILHGREPAQARLATALAAEPWSAGVTHSHSGALAAILHG